MDLNNEEILSLEVHPTWGQSLGWICGKVFTLRSLLIKNFKKWKEFWLQIDPDRTVSLKIVAVHWDTNLVQSSLCASLKLIVTQEVQMRYSGYSDILDDIILWDNVKYYLNIYWK